VVSGCWLCRLPCLMGHLLGLLCALEVGQLQMRSLFWIPLFLTRLPQSSSAVVTAAICAVHAEAARHVVPAGYGLTLPDDIYRLVLPAVSRIC
jgi:hypothetical protein